MCEIMIDLEEINEATLKDSIQTLLLPFLEDKKHTILLVDDEENNLQFLKRTLRSKYSILTAQNGQEALEVLAQHNDDISLVISDQRMPNMQGTEFMKILTSKNLRLLRRTVRDIVRRGTSATKTKDIWPSVVEVEEKYIETFRNKVDYYVNTTHEYELGVYKKEIEKFLEEGKIAKEELLFTNFLDAVDGVDKSLIPDTSLMWEFVDK